MPLYAVTMSSVPLIVLKINAKTTRILGLPRFFAIVSQKQKKAKQNHKEKRTLPTKEAATPGVNLRRNEIIKRPIRAKGIPKNILNIQPMVFPAIRGIMMT